MPPFPNAGGLESINDEVIERELGELLQRALTSSKVS
jgi:hypothetical protein